MFKLIGRVADRYSILLIIGWVMAAILVTAFAPNLDDVLSNDQSDFLPEDSSSRHGQALLETHFPDQANDQSIVIVFDAGEGENVLSEENSAYIGQVTNWLVSEDAPETVDGIQSPVFAPELAEALTSDNNQIAMLVVSVNTTDAYEQADLFHEIGDYLDGSPITTYRTGSISIFTQFDESIVSSVDSTIFITVALVIVMLLLIYRSPVSPFIPLTVVTTAYLIARGFVAVLADNGTFTVSGTAAMLLIVVMYGAGTDYCLFLISRFREEMAESDDAHKSVRGTVHRVGESISSSAGTTTTGFLALSFAQLGLFNTTGPTLAIGVVISLLAGLTFTPAILRLLGQRAFWPRKAEIKETGAFYRRTSQMVSKRPLLTIGLIVLLMGPFALYSLNQETSFDFLQDLPDDAESVEGFRVLEDSIGAGEMQPISGIAVLDDTHSLNDVESITAKLTEVEGVSDVRSTTHPMGVGNEQTANITSMNRQLLFLSSLLVPQEGAPDPTPEQMQTATAAITEIPNYLTLVGETDPEVANTQAYQDAFAALGSFDGTPETSQVLAGSLVTLASELEGNHVALSQLPPAIQSLLGGEMLAQLSGSYFNAETNSARFEIVLDTAPYSSRAMDSVERINDVFADYSSDAGLSGTTANNADIRDILVEDTRFTFALVLGGIFIVLMLMLRSLVAPSYLIVTLVFSYSTTLGITQLASGILWGTEALTWWVPFFMFVFLVALGIDYSIFLFGRIKEEVRDHGVNGGIHQAVQSTGSIITSAGIIVAGTFGALMSGEILGLAQIGFAVSVGILIDTFIVRTILDPALASLFGKWTWFPSKVPVEGIVSAEDEPFTGSGKSVPQTSGTD